MSALHHHHHLSVAPLSRHTVSGLQFRSLLTSDLWPSDAVFLVYAAGKKQSPMQVFFLLLLFFYRVSVKSRCFCVCSVHLTFVKRCLLFFCLFVEAFPRLRLLHFSTLRCCSNVTVTFVTERLFTVGVCTRLWPLVFGVVPSYFCEFSFILFSHSPECLTKKQNKKKTSPVFTLLPFCQSCSCRWTVLSWRDSVQLNFVKCIYPNLVSMSVKSHDGTVVLFTYNVWII